MHSAGLTLNLDCEVPTTCTHSGPRRLLYELISQYPILSAIATELSLDDILNFGLTSKDIWSCMTSAVEEEKLAKSVTQQALQCDGLRIQISAGIDEAYLLPCTKKRGIEVRRCQGCGTGVCETCRFRVSHGTVLTMPKKQRWFFPSRTRSGSLLVNDNLECLVSSFTQQGHGAHQPLKNPCPCTYQDRWLEKWLCVPCLNKDLWTPPVEKELSELIPDTSLETMLSPPVEVV